MYTLIAPFSHAIVQVEFSSNNCCSVVNKALSKQFEAILVGYVYLTDEARYISFFLPKQNSTYKNLDYPDSRGL